MVYRALISEGSYGPLQKSLLGLGPPCDSISSGIMDASKREHVYENIKAIETYKKLTPNVMDGIDAILNNKPPVIVERS